MTPRFVFQRELACADELTIRHRSVSMKKLLVIILFVAFLAPAVAQQPASQTQASTDLGNAKFRNPALPTDERVNDLISRMTLEEKVSQMRDHAVGIPRLGVPPYECWNEGLHGVAFSGYATNFPQVIGMAATWDTDLVHRMAEVISTEARAKYNQAMRDDHHEMFFGLTFWAPNVNIFRDPRWGRGQETYGEDPFLTGRMAVAFVTGMQGDDPQHLKVVSTPKHFAVHSGPEPLRHRFNVDVTPHDLEDTYLPAFRAAVTEGHAQSVMCAYNAIDGAPACASEMLLKDHLRNAWGFDGYVVSDCSAIDDVANGHHYVADLNRAGAVSLTAGTDNECGNFGSPKLGEAVKQALVTEAQLDTALTRLFLARFRLGMFDPPDSYAYGRIPFSENNSPAHRALALQAAREAMVLLKNDGVLPLAGGRKRIAVIGPTAELVQALEGNYNGTPPQPVSPVAGIEKRFGAANVISAQGALLAQDFAVPVERSAFRSGKAQGLKGEYFANPDLEGKPLAVKTDPAINFNWSGAVP